MQTKLGILTSQTKRAIRVSSSPASTHRSLDKIKSLFLENGYPEHKIDKVIKNNLKYTVRNTKKQTDREQVTYMRLCSLS